MTRLSQLNFPRFVSSVKKSELSTSFYEQSLRQHSTFARRHSFEQHIDDLTRTFAAKELAKLFFVKFDLVFFYELNKILRRVAGQGGFCKMRIRGNEIFGLCA